MLVSLALTLALFQQEQPAPQLGSGETTPAETTTNAADPQATIAAEAEAVADTPPPPATDATSLIAQIEGRLERESDIIAELAARKARERHLTSVLLPVITRTDLDEGAQGEILRAVQPRISELEAANSDWAAAQLDPDGFAALYTGNPDLAEELIRLAGRNESHRGRIIAALEPVALAGAYDGAEFAEMADAFAVTESRPQPYGTQLTCVDGMTERWPLADPDATAEARNAIGLDPLVPVEPEACETDD